MGKDWGAVASGHHLPPPSSLKPTHRDIRGYGGKECFHYHKQDWRDTYRNDAWFCICQVFGESEIVLGMKTTSKAALHPGVPTTSGQPLSVVDNIAGTVQIDHLKLRHNFIVVNTFGYPSNVWDWLSPETWTHTSDGVPKCEWTLRRRNSGNVVVNVLLLTLVDQSHKTFQSARWAPSLLSSRNTKIYSGQHYGPQEPCSITSQHLVHLSECHQDVSQQGRSGATNSGDACTRVI